MSGLFEELKRRNVVRVGVAYLAASWLVLQVIDLVIESVAAPAWVMPFILAATGIGFPIVLIFAWAYEITPEGVKREKDVDRSQSITNQTGRRLDRIIIAVLVVAIGMLLIERFVYLGPTETVAEAQPEIVQTDRQSVAVLPFANRSNSEDDTFFVDGVHDDILTQLAKISALKVISRTSVMQYRDTEKPMRVIGDELDVRTIMEGSVQRAGDRVRINVQLIDAESDEHIWADIYDRELTAANIFEIQSEIATAIAGELRANLTDQEADRIAIRPTENLEAYEAYLIGRQRMARRTTADITEARNQFERAINLDPNFALAYVGISDTIQLGVDYGGRMPADVAREARPFIERALELDDRSGEAYISLASVYEYSGDYELAAENYERGLELAPNYSQGHMWHGLLLMNTLGQPEAALDRFRVANTHDPLSVINYMNLAAALSAVGEQEAAFSTVRRFQEIDPDYGFGWSYLGNITWMVYGRIDTAIEMIHKALAVDPGDPVNHTDLAYAYKALQDDATAACWIESALELNQDAGWTQNAAAYFAALDGDLTTAAEFGRRAPESLYGPGSWTGALSFTKAYDILDGNLSRSLSAYEAAYTEFGDNNGFELNRGNFGAAIDYAHLLQISGEDERGNRILDEVEAFIASIPRLANMGSMLSAVRIHALRGNFDDALSALRSAVDEGWRMNWRYYYEFDPILDPLRSDPAFEDAFSVIRKDMAEQLAKVRAWETLETRCEPN